MEGSAAGPAAAQGGQGEGQGGAEQAQSPDLAQLAQQFQSFEAGQQELRQFLLGEPWRAQEQQQEAGQEQEQLPDIDLSFLDPDAAEFDPQQFAQRLAPIIEQVADRKTQAAIAPLNERLDEERRTREAHDLVTEYPELGDPDVGPRVVAEARRVAEAYGRPELANQPWFWRMTYQAGLSVQRAREEGPDDGPAAAHLEGGSGARPGAQQVDMGEEIFGKGPERLGSQVLPFG